MATLDPQAVFVVGMFGSFGVVCLGVAIVGLWRLRPHDTHEPSTYWQKELRSWGIGPTTGPEAIDQLMRVIDHTRGWTIFGGGLGGLMVVTLWAVITFLVARNWLVLSILDSSALAISVCAGVLGGVSAGYAFGIRRLRIQTAGSTTYGELSPRHVTRYRSVWFPRVLTALLVFQIILTLVAVLYLHGPLRTELVNTQVITLPSPWLIGLLPLAMVLMVVISEVLMHWVAGVPRLLIVPDVQVASRADEMLRTHMIWGFQQQTVLLLPFLSIAQMELIFENLPHVPYSAPHSAL